MGLIFVGLILSSLTTVQNDSARDNRGKPDSYGQKFCQKQMKSHGSAELPLVSNGLLVAAGAVVNLCHPVMKRKSLGFFLLHFHLFLTCKPFALEVESFSVEDVVW